MALLRTIFGLGLTALLVTGCAQSADIPSSENQSSTSTSEQESNVEESSTDSSDDSESIEVNEGIFNVEITLPPAFGESVSEEDLQSAVEEQGWISGTKNENGSITYVMTNGQRDDYLDEMRTSLNESLQQAIDEESDVYKEITYNDDLTEFDVVVNRQAFENSFSFLQFTIELSSSFYQTFDGVSADDSKVIINYIEEGTGDIFSTYDSSEQ